MLGFRKGHITGDRTMNLNIYTKIDTFLKIYQTFRKIDIFLKIYQI